MARAQTTIDFALGASVFLVTVAFVFAFVPSLFTPSTTANPSAPVVADRVANDLTHDQLAVAGRPSVLQSNAPQRLRHARLDVPATMSVNVTISPSTDVTSTSGIITARGPAPPGDATVAWRVVTVNGVQEELRVSVW